MPARLSPLPPPDLPGGGNSAYAPPQRVALDRMRGVRSRLSPLPPPDLPGLGATPEDADGVYDTYIKPILDSAPVRIPLNLLSGTSQLVGAGVEEATSALAGTPSRVRLTPEAATSMNRGDGFIDTLIGDLTGRNYEVPSAGAQAFRGLKQASDFAVEPIIEAATGTALPSNLNVNAPGAEGEDALLQRAAPGAAPDTLGEVGRTAAAVGRGLAETGLDLPFDVGTAAYLRAGGRLAEVARGVGSVEDVLREADELRRLGNVGKAQELEAAVEELRAAELTDKITGAAALPGMAGGTIESSKQAYEQAQEHGWGSPEALQPAAAAIMSGLMTGSAAHDALRPVETPRVQPAAAEPTAPNVYGGSEAEAAAAVERAIGDQEPADFQAREFLSPVWDKKRTPSEFRLPPTAEDVVAPRRPLPDVWDQPTPQEAEADRIVQELIRMGDDPLMAEREADARTMETPAPPLSPVLEQGVEAPERRQRENPVILERRAQEGGGVAADPIPPVAAPEVHRGPTGPDVAAAEPVPAVPARPLEAAADDRPPGAEVRPREAGTTPDRSREQSRADEVVAAAEADGASPRAALVDQLGLKPSKAGRVLREVQERRAAAEKQESLRAREEFSAAVRQDVVGDASRQAPVRAEHAAAVDVADARVAPEPSAAQKEAGNFKKGHLKWNGLDIALETPKGGTRVATDGSWRVDDYPASYGYVKRTKGRDGDQVDVFMGDSPESRQVYVIDQIDPKTGRFDEHKSMIGFRSQEEALDTYRRAYTDDANARIGGVTPMSVESFKSWTRSRNTRGPLSRLKWAAEAQAYEKLAPGAEVARPAVDRGGLDPGPQTAAPTIAADNADAVRGSTGGGGGHVVDGAPAHKEAVAATLQQMESRLRQRDVTEGARVPIRGAGQGGAHTGRIEGWMGAPSVKEELGLEHLTESPKRIAAAIKKDGDNPIFLEAEAAAVRKDPFGYIADAEERAGMQEPAAEPEIGRNSERRADERRGPEQPVEDERRSDSAEDRRFRQRRDDVAREHGLAPKHSAVEGLVRSEIDTRTGVWNANAYEAEIKRIARGEVPAPAAVTEVDIAGAGATNKHYGEPFTDEILRTAARALKYLVGDSGTVYRKGGDEFVVHWNDYESGQRVHSQIAQALQDAEIVVAKGGVTVAQWRGVDHYDGFGKEFDEASAAVYAKKPKEGDAGYKQLPTGLAERIEHGRKVQREGVPPVGAGVRASEGSAPRKGSEGREDVDLAPTGTDEKFSAKKSPGFYSQLEKVATDKKAPAAASGNDWTRYLADPKRAVKSEEMKWTGLDDFLTARGTRKVTKEEIGEFLKQNNVDVEEVELGGHDLKRDVRIEEEAGDDGRAWFSLSIDGQDVGRGFDTRNEAERYAGDLGEDPKEAPKFGSYTLPGGENYRELLLTLPEQEIKSLPAGYSIRETDHPSFARWQVFYPDGRNVLNGSGATREEAKVAGLRSLNSSERPGSFHSGHYDEPNILAHARFNERTDAEGKRVLFIEEIQSDWAQKGRRSGFDDSAAYERDLNEYRRLHVELEDISEASVRTSAQEKRLGEIQARMDDLDAAWHGDIQYKQGHGTVPSAPFVEDTEKWSSLAMKRMVRWAAENGFDRVAWTTGQQQAERYDLSKQVKQIVYKKNADDTFKVSAILKNGSGQPLGEKLTAEELVEHVGKDVADKIAGGEGQEENLGSGSGTSQRDMWTSLSGGDLKVGGEGMKGFYDKILPSVAGKLGKKFGAKVGETKIPDGRQKPESGAHVDVTDAAAEAALSDGHEWDDVSAGDRDRYRSEARARLAGVGPFVHSMDITEEMRRSVTQEGQPLFAAKKAGEEAGVSLEAIAKDLGPRFQARVTGDDTLSIVTPAGRKITVRRAENGIEWTPERARRFRETYGRELSENEVVAGSWRRLGDDGLIALAKDHADIGTFRHEWFHAAMDLALTPAEKDAVLRRYKDEEAAADAYGAWEPKTPNGLFAKVRDFFRRLVRAFRLDADKVFARVRSGKVFDSAAGVSGDREVFQKFGTKPKPGQMGLEGIGEDVPRAGEKAKAPEQQRMFSDAEMLVPSEARVTEGREADGPLFTQERDTALREEAKKQTSLPSAPSVDVDRVKRIMKTPGGGNMVVGYKLDGGEVTSRRGPTKWMIEEWDKGGLRTSVRGFDGPSGLRDAADYAATKIDSIDRPKKEKFAVRPIPPGAKPGEKREAQPKIQIKPIPPGVRPGDVIRVKTSSGETNAIVLNRGDQAATGKTMVGRVAVRLEGGKRAYIRPEEILGQATRRPPSPQLTETENIRAQTAGVKHKLKDSDEVPFNFDKMNISPENKKLLAKTYAANPDLYKAAAGGEGGKMTFNDFRRAGGALAATMTPREFSDALASGAPLSDPAAVVYAKNVSDELARAVGETHAELRRAVAAGRGVQDAERDYLGASLQKANFDLAFKGAQSQAARTLVAFKILSEEKGPLEQVIRRMFAESC